MTVKVISLLRRKPELSAQAFRQHWVEVHARMSHDVPGIRRYVLDFVLDEPTRPDVPSIGIGGSIDGIAELWFENTDAYWAFRASDAARHWFSDGASFIGAAQSFLVEEHPVIG